LTACAGVIFEGPAGACPPLSGMLSAALFISNFQVGGIGR